MPIHTSDMPFQGAKIALLCGADLVTYLRDDYYHIWDPNCWDLPGGVREPDETAEDCALRETREEFGITVPPEAIFHRGEYIAQKPMRRVAFFMARIPQATVDQIVFGDEGQCWRMMPVADFITRTDAVADLQTALRDSKGVL